jgi:hypothetical protein
MGEVLSGELRAGALPALPVFIFFEDTSRRLRPRRKFEDVRVRNLFDVAVRVANIQKHYL